MKLAEMQAVRERASAEARAAEAAARAAFLAATAEQRAAFDTVVERIEKDYEQSTGEAMRYSRYISWGNPF